MKVCFIAAANSVHTQRWVAAMAAHGHMVRLLSTSPVPLPLPPTLAGIPIWSFPVGRPGMTRRERLLALLTGWSRVGSMVQRMAPDLVHVHSLPNPVAVPFLLRLQPLVISVWGSDVVQSDARKRRWYPYVLQHAAALTATSPVLAEVTRTYLRRPRTIDVVAFGIDTTELQPGPLHAIGSPFRLGCLKRLDHGAGQDVLLTAFAGLAADRAGRLPTLVLGGDGPSRPALEAQARALGIADRVTLQGLVPHAEVAQFMRQLDLFVLPSRAEAFGVAALEAQACGVPIVAAAVGGLPAVVADGVTGLLVPPEDPAALQAALARCMVDPALVTGFGAAGPAWVRAHYEWSQNVGEMLAVYRRVVAV